MLVGDVDFRAVPYSAVLNGVDSLICIDHEVGAFGQAGLMVDAEYVGVLVDGALAVSFGAKPMFVLLDVPRELAELAVLSGDLMVAEIDVAGEVSYAASVNVTLDS